jgi:RNA recognition motif-containing protein
MQGSKLFVGNLSHTVTAEDLNTLFSGYGEVKEAKVIAGKGFGFVEMSSQAEAEGAKAALNGKEFSGLSMNVDAARPPRSGDRRDSHRRH